MVSFAQVPLEEYLNLLGHSLLTSIIYVMLKRRFYEQSVYNAKNGMLVYVNAIFAVVGIYCSVVHKSILQIGVTLTFICPMLSFLLCFRIIISQKAALVSIGISTLYYCFVQFMEVKSALISYDRSLFKFYPIDLFVLLLSQSFICIIAFGVSDFINFQKEERNFRGKSNSAFYNDFIQSFKSEDLIQEYESSLLLEPSLRLRISYLALFLKNTLQFGYIRKKENVNLNLVKTPKYDDLTKMNLSSSTANTLIKGIQSYNFQNYEKAYSLLAAGVTNSLLEWTNTSVSDKEYLRIQCFIQSCLQYRLTQDEKYLIDLDVKVCSLFNTSAREALIHYAKAMKLLSKYNSRENMITKLRESSLYLLYAPTDAFLLLLLGLLMRLVLLNYGIWHDRRSALKFTDIDYFVFSDASKYVSIGMSPYMRDTYRYTPMLAILLLPTQYGFPSWGKYLFSISDLIAGWLMIKLLSRRISYKRSLIYSSFWILNPFVAIISTRGNCEAILGILSIALLYLIEKKSVWLASLILGFSVHFKIYPFMYGIAFLVYFSKPKKGSTFMEKFLSLLSINQLKIVVGSLFMFTICNLLMYYLYGSPFLEHTYLYHFGRTDHRHNFSLHHLNLYYESSFGAKASSLFAFLPQLSLCMLIPLVFGKKNLPGTLFAQTFAFVTFNKVCTSQVC